MLKHLTSLFLFVLCLCTGLAPAQAQGNVKTYKRNGLAFFEAGRYENSAEALAVYRKYKPSDDDIWYPLGVCRYQLNQLDEAETLLEGVLRAGKAPNEAILYLGRIAHHQNQFAKAASYYKSYLSKIGDKHPLYASVVDDIRRAGFGDRFGTSSGELEAYSENCGDAINSRGDEFRPILSPNYQDRMYFSTIRDGVTGGFRDDSGLANPEEGSLRADMYAAGKENGRWSGAEPLSYLLNSVEHDVAQDFTMNGQVLVFRKGRSLFSGDLLVDTFRRQAEDRNLFAPTWENGPLDAAGGDNDVFFLGDSIILFSRVDINGYGGYDLMISTRRNGNWSVPRNLGPEINSSYDERSPFLAEDGRTLYFSSNRVDLSIGGFDVLKAVFDDRTVQWLAPKNVGLSINSAGDERNFRIANNGLEGYYDSTIRTTGKGGKDIFVAYFKEELREQTNRSVPATFVQVLEAARQKAIADGGGFLEAGGEREGMTDGRVKVPVSVTLSPLLYGKDDKIQTPGNIERARDVIQFLTQYPSSRVVITAHSDDADPERFRTYFGIKRAEQFAEYLTSRSVEPERIQLMSVGSLFPLAENAYNGQTSSQGQRLNRRLELHVVPSADYRLNKNFEDPKVPDFIASDLFEVYRDLQEGVVFRIQLAASAQMYDDPNWLRQRWPVVQRSFDQELYQFQLGAYASYRGAKQMKAELAKAGYTDTFVVPYLNGLRLSNEEVVTFATQYPELAVFLAQTQPVKE